MKVKGDHSEKLARGGGREQAVIPWDPSLFTCVRVVSGCWKGALRLRSPHRGHFMFCSAF